MKIRRNLITGLIGVALMAAPIAAAAKDNDSGRNNSRQAQAESRSNESRGNAPAHNEAQAMHNEFRGERSARVETRAPAPEMNRHEGRDQRNDRIETRNVAPAPAPRNEYRGNESRGNRDVRAYNNAPVENEHRDVRAERDHDRNWNREGRDYRNDGRDYRTYGRDYDHDDYDHDREYAAGGWIMPRGYYGGACGWARHLRNVYRHDELTGHPAAAADLLGQMHRADRACRGVPYGYNNYRDRY
jgi:hypothetical protein